ncbi:hypothetical protein L207DRAFT_508969 [Hyaloscypha variabilis F]|uniref:Pentatricopeptide repeat protein n=1 Tax=Hyaloscypha variabilis (strain UAMH 11265 / GT02V1 / F) TaxID=1149755 RepID=A0A2J6S0D6_HYAVF|nr:hypothetical protein L207DRAFT_508969 [Hyaloscypha variabilis F]
MPPRFNLLTKRWSSFDLPILPFLAPRVFQPWPRKGRRVHSGSAQAAQEKLHAIKEPYEKSPPLNNRDQANVVESTPHIRGQQRTAQDFGSLSNDAWLQGLDKSPGKTEGQRLGAGRSDISEEEVYQGYGGKCGPSSNKPRLGEVGGNSNGPDSPEQPEEEEFHKTYQEIWGPRVKKQPATVPVRRVSYLANDDERPEPVKPVRRRALNINYFFLSRNAIQRHHQRVGLKRNRMKRQLVDKSNALAARRRRRLYLKARAIAKHRKIQLSRPKFVRHGPYADPELYRPFRSWHRRFAALNRRNEFLSSGRKLPTHGFRQTTKFPLTFLKTYMDETNSIELRLKWEKLTPRRKMEIWPELMIETLQSWPGKTLTIVAGTYAQEPFPPPYALSDCLNYVIARFLSGRQSPANNVVRRIHNSIFGLLRSGPTNYLQISQHSIFLLLSRTEPFLLKKLYKIMTHVNHPLHRNTLMNFASRLAKAGETDCALEILQKLKYYGSDFNTPEMLSLCSTVLDRSFRGADTTYSDSDIFERMLEWDMQPNIITYNVLVKNSVDIGDHSTAWQIHDMMIESGIEPDAYTYSILLNDSKKRMDSQAIEAVMGFVREKGLKSAYIVTDVLDAIFLLYQQKAKETDQPHEPQAAFNHMLKVYVENFRIDPLVRIIPWISEILPSVQRPEAAHTGAEFEHPPVPTLTLMIIAFIHGLRDVWAVKQFYDHFCLLLSSGDPGVADLLGTTHIWNAVLLGLGKFPDTLVDCTTIIGDMLGPINAPLNESSVSRQPDPGSSSDHEDLETQSKAEDSGDEAEKSGLQPLVDSTPSLDFSQLPGNVEGESRRPHIPPKPSVHTWSILLKIFMSQHQTRAAEKVLTMMQAKGTEPNFVTWTTLVNGYARLQDIENTVEVVSRMARSGLEADAQWLVSMFKVRNRKGFLEAVRKGNTQLDPGTEVLNQLQDDLRKGTELDQLQDGMRCLQDVEQSSKPADKTEHFIEDPEADAEYGAVGDPEIWEDFDDNDVDPRWEQEPDRINKE